MAPKPAFLARFQLYSLRMNVRKIIFGLALLSLAFGARAEEVTCDVCGEPIHDQFYNLEDRVEGKTKKICENCEKIKERCFICGMPVKENYKSLLDGRYICARDLKDAIESDVGSQGNLPRRKGRSGPALFPFPRDARQQRARLSIVDKFHLENLFHAPGYESSCVSVYGATASNPLPNGKFLHTIDILSYLRKTAPHGGLRPRIHPRLGR